jgi:hypothetical protein
LLVVNAVSLAFQPSRLLSLCCVRTETDCGFGSGFFAMGGAELSLQVVSKRKANDRSSLRRAMTDPKQVHCVKHECLRPQRLASMGRIR